VIRFDSLSPCRRCLGVVILVGGLLALAGCGGKTVGSVSGKATYKGEPVTSGSVVFTNPAKGVAADGQLDGSGNYSIKDLEAGTYKVSLSPPQVEQLEPGKTPKKVTFNVPKKYLDSVTTPISKEVKAGKNDIPVEITD